MTNYDIPSTVNRSQPSALTPKNIKSGILVTEIWLFNTDVFTDNDLSPSALTDRPLQDKKKTLKVSDSGFPHLKSISLQQQT
jgi:hypothetical protein